MNPDTTWTEDILSPVDMITVNLTRDDRKIAVTFPGNTDDIYDRIGREGVTEPDDILGNVLELAALTMLDLNEMAVDAIGFAIDVWSTEWREARAQYRRDAIADDGSARTFPRDPEGFRYMIRDGALMISDDAVTPPPNRGGFQHVTSVNDGVADAFKPSKGFGPIAASTALTRDKIADFFQDRLADGTYRVEPPCACCCGDH